MLLLTLEDSITSYSCYKMLKPLHFNSILILSIFFDFILILILFLEQ